MKITRTSLISGVKRTLNINCTQEQLDSWRRGQLIQDAMPQLTQEEREFVKTGITQEEWDTLSTEEEEEDMIDLRE